jgi:hypothetical protein
MTLCNPIDRSVMLRNHASAPTARVIVVVVAVVAVAVVVVVCVHARVCVCVEGGGVQWHEQNLRDLCRVELMCGCSHRSETRPQRRILHKPTQPHRVLPLASTSKRMQHGRVRRHCCGHESPVHSANETSVVYKAFELRVGTKVGCGAVKLCLWQDLRVHEHGARVVPHGQLVVGQRCKDRPEK